MNPYAIDRTTAAEGPEGSKRRKAIERARKNVEAWKAWSPRLRVFYGLIFFALIGGLGYAVRGMIEVVPDEHLTWPIVGLAVGGVIGFKLACYTQVMLSAVMTPHSDQLLVEYHDRLQDAGLL